MVVAVAALVVAGTGVGAAATGLINGSQIRNGTIAGAKLKNSTITGTKIANRTITAGKLASGVLKAYRFQLTPANEGFYFNDSHDAAYALVGPSGYSGTSNVGVSNPVPGVYCVAVTGVVASTSWASVSPDYYNDDTGQFTATQVELSSGAPGCPGEFQVNTYSVATVYQVTNGALKPSASSPGNGPFKKR